MGLVKKVNTKTLIEVAKQLESMRNTYRRFHKYEIPVGNPIDEELKKISVNLGALAKLSGNSIKDNRYDSSREAGNKYKSSKIERAKLDREATGVRTTGGAVMGMEKDNKSEEQLI